MKLQNSKGTVWYGLHMYPGVAEYAEPGKQPFRVFLNENTIRNMDASFAGRPVFVHHVDDVATSVDELRKEADGWVLESFFNQADGRHWVKFLIVTEKAEKAIKNGMRLSNCYVAKGYGSGGLWNGVEYQKEVMGGEYEHLAIVPNPRYEESVILTPEAFKQYNDDNLAEIKRIANERGKGMLKLFKRTKVENAADLDGMHLVLEKSGREVALTTLINEADSYAMAKKEPQMASGDHHVEVKGQKMTVNELVDKHMKMCDELDAMKAKNTDEGGEKAGDEGGDADHELENDGDEEAKKKALQLAEHEDKEIEEAKKKNEADAAAAAKVAAKAAAAAKAERLRNADKNQPEVAPQVVLSADKVAMGKSRYGS